MAASAATVAAGPSSAAAWSRLRLGHEGEGSDLGSSPITATGASARITTAVAAMTPRIEPGTLGAHSEKASVTAPTPSTMPSDHHALVPPASAIALAASVTAFAPWRVDVTPSAAGSPQPIAPPRMRK